ncbi:MAG TPA: ABC transporter permease [Vicinamibacterales bacterium]|nr:ABC transporter permease [Vicinamibacterales bacterium]
MRWFSRRSDADYQAEISEHLEAETQANIDRGLSPDEARRVAHAAFGSRASVRQRLHEGRRLFWMSAVGQDMRFGLRAILKHRLLSCIVVLTMSVGIGCTTAVFSLLNAIVFAPPVAFDPDSFVQVVRPATSSPDVAFDHRHDHDIADVARYEALRNQIRSLRMLAAWSSESASAPLGGDDAEPAGAILTSCNVFQVISDARALAGRFLQTSDCDDRLPVAVISERAWRRRFAADPAIVGRPLAYGRHVLTIVGVAPDLRSNADLAGFALWLPYTLQPQLQDLFRSRSGSCEPSDSPPCKAWMIQNSRWLSLAGRLAPGFSRSAAAAELKVLTSREADSDIADRLTVSDGSLWSKGALGVAVTFALILLLPTVVALIVCTNVASLLLSRAVKRQQEMAIRLAIGGGRLTLARMLLVEQLLLAGVAAVLSLSLVKALPPILVARLPGLSERILHGTGPDWRVFVYLAAVALLTAIGAGTAPALQSLNLRIVEALKGRHTASGSRGISRTQAVLICAQVVLSMVPVVGTAAFLRAERRFHNPGFDAGQVVFASVFRDRESGAALEWPVERVRALPAVRSTAFATSTPPFVDGMITIERPGARSPHEFPVLAVSPDYFRTVGITLVSGRPFREDDVLRSDSGRPVIVSTTLARHLFPGQHAVGKTFDAPVEHTRFEIVGIASDAMTFTNGSRFTSDRSLIYQILDSKPDTSGRPADPVLLVRFGGDIRQFTTDLQAVLKPVHKRVVVDSLQSVVDESLDVLRLLRTLVMVTAGIGLGLALTGVFGILAFAAAQRRKEVAIRAAVGASRADIFGAILRPALWPTGFGIALGTVLSFGALRFFESVSREQWAASDPGAYVTGAFVLVCAALAAMSSPAWRAATVNPSKALRED